MTERAPSRIVVAVTLALVAGSVPAIGVEDPIPPSGSGSPTAGDAPPACGERDLHPPIRITEDHGPLGFTWTNPVTGEREHRPGSGVVAGNGTAESPYVIAGWCIAPSPEGPRLAHRPPVSAGILIRNTTAHVVLRDNRVDGTLAVAGPEQDVGIGMYDVGPVVVRNNTLTDNDEGLEVVESAAATIHHNVVTHNDGRGVSLWVDLARIHHNIVTDSGRSGIALGEADSVRIHHNTVTDSGWRGVRLDTPGRTTIRDNLVADNAGGGMAVTNGLFDGSGSSRLTVRGNAFTDNGRHGLIFFGPDRVRVSNNTVTNNDGAGVAVDDSDGARIDHNTITDNDLGVALVGSNASATSNNTIAANGREGILLVDADHAAIHGNNVHDNGEAGLAVAEDSDAVNATKNWWGAANGPSGGVADTCTGETADGDGDEIVIREGSEVCFDPWLTSSNPDAGAA